MEAIMNISFNRQHYRAQMQPADNPKAQAISDGINKLLLKDVKLGDLLKVEIIDSLNKQITVMLPDGTIFEAKLDQPLDFYIGQQVSFQVKDIIGKQIHMELAAQADPGQQETNVDINNILKQLDIPLTKDAQEAIKLLMQKMLPVNKDSIKQIEFGLKSSQLPIDSLLSMLENEIPIIPATIKQMEAYKNGEIKLQGQLEVMMENIIASDDIEVLDQMHKLLLSTKEQVGQVGNNPALEEAQSPKQAPEQTQVQAQTKEQIQNQLTDPAQAKETIDQGKPLVQKPLELSQESLLNKDINLLKKEIINLFKESFFIDPSQVKDKLDTKLEKINEVYKEIYKLADKLEKAEEKLPEPQKIQLYSDIKSNIEFLAIANKYDTMLHIPLVIQDQFKHGELYIFNKKKSGKKGYHEASMLISLETISLGTVETFIKKYNKQVTVQFKTDNEEIENIIKNKIQLLTTSLKEKGYELISASYIPNTQPFSVKGETAKSKDASRYRFDTKA